MHDTFNESEHHTDT